MQAKMQRTTTVSSAFYSLILENISSCWAILADEINIDIMLACNLSLAYQLPAIVIAGCMLASYIILI